MTAATTVVLFGATGDLSKRKLLPGLMHLLQSGLMDDLRVVATSLEELTHEEFLELAATAIREHSSHDVSEQDLRDLAQRTQWVPATAGADGLREAVDKAEAELGEGARRLHYLSVPPRAALPVVAQLAEAGLVERSRIIMEKPFGTDLASARSLNARLHEVFDEDQIFRIDHFLGKEAAQNILAFRFANGLFEPIWHRNHIDHIQIDVPETLGLETRADFYEATGAYRDMVVTHLFQVMAFTAMEPPTALEPRAISEEKNKVFRSMLPILPENVVRGQFDGYKDIPGVRHESETETFIALKCFVDNWRWAGVPFFLRTGKQLAEGRAGDLDRLQGAAAVDVPGRLGRGRPRARPPDLRPRRQVADVVVVLRQAAGSGHAAGQAEHAVLGAGDRLGGIGARGVRAADPRRRAW